MDTTNSMGHGHLQSLSISHESHHQYRSESDLDDYRAWVAYYTARGYTFSDEFGGLSSPYYSDDPNTPPVHRSQFLPDGLEWREGKVFRKLEPDDEYLKFKSNAECAQFFTEDGFVDTSGLMSAVCVDLRSSDLQSSDLRSSDSESFDDTNDRTSFCAKRTLKYFNQHERDDKDPEYEYVRGLSSSFFKTDYGWYYYHVNFLAKPTGTNLEPDIFFAELEASPLTNLPRQVVNWCIFDPKHDGVKKIVEKPERCMVLHPEGFSCPCNQNPDKFISNKFISGGVELLGERLYA
ncbi:unnamed protein product [Cuscuta epithymum]|uniref:DUF3615 domain-containing protein n=1 Tax=Cuscuta epithymum TaxID=186058 RepID=A0AAV0EAR8_9ASTE|nr:unnamed protein product [Cuscuta epithymum]CAH9121086.1 unnamed protein product [Cuscuta epithymum]